jgi:hypothetical protein
MRAEILWFVRYYRLPAMSNISPFLIRLFRPSFVGPKNPPSPRGKVRAFGTKESVKLKYEIPCPFHSGQGFCIL